MGDTLPADSRDRKPLEYFRAPPWIDTQNTQIHPKLPGITNKNEERSRIMTAAMNQLRLFNPSLTI